MVKINYIYGSRGDDDSSASVLEESKYRLLYSKSKVYIYPTTYARDNILGFMALIKCVCPFQHTRCQLNCLPSLQEAVNSTYLLA